MKRSALVLFAVVALAGCGNAPRRASPLTVTHPTFHAASQIYTVRQVRRAFADQGVRLRNVTRPGWRPILAFLDGRPAHQVFVYVSVGACKCLLRPPIRHAHETHHGDVAVLWRVNERSAVRAALRELR